MEYTLKKLGNLAGVSGRTLRFYDEINLLKPVRINSSGYRIYGQKEVDQLQQILFNLLWVYQHLSKCKYFEFKGEVDMDHIRPPC